MGVIGKTDVKNFTWRCAQLMARLRGWVKPTQRPGRIVIFRKPGVGAACGWMSFGQPTRGDGVFARTGWQGIC